MRESKSFPNMTKDVTKARALTTKIGWATAGVPAVAPEISKPTTPIATRKNVGFMLWI